MIDILFFAIIALVLGYRLWSVLGQRDDDDSSRPNPFRRADDPVEDDDQNKVILLPQRGERSAALAACMTTPPPNSLAGALDQIQKVDPAFDEKEFLGGAEKAFRRIVDVFAMGDLSAVERLLSPGVLVSFQQAVKGRVDAGQSLRTKIIEMKDKDIVAARLENTTAFVTVSFVSLQTNILTDSSGVVLSGGADKVEEAQDIWTFSRDTKSPNPNWTIVETKA